MVLGNQLEDLFEKLFTSLQSFTNSVSNATGKADRNEAALKVMLDEVQNMKNNILPSIFSDTVYITENQLMMKLTSIDEVEGDVEWKRVQPMVMSKRIIMSAISDKLKSKIYKVYLIYQKKVLRKNRY